MSEIVEWQFPESIPDHIATLDDSDIIRETYFWIWAVRRALWRDLIGQGILVACLHHYPDWREGQGPTLWLSETEPAPITDPFEWYSTDSGLCLQADTWPRSDLLYEYSHLWNSPDMPLITRHYEEFEHDKHEYSFEIEFELASGPDPGPLTPWSDLSSDQRTTCIENLGRLRSAGDVLWVDDILACIAFHPGTTARVLLESGILETTIGREAVLRNSAADDTVKALASIRHN